MSAVIVEHAGLLSTVQDLGRRGFAHLGVSHSGAADTLALRLGNRLLANHDNDAAIETTLTGAVFRFEAPTTIALTGAPCEAHIAGRPVPLLRPIALRAGDVLTIGPASTGVRTMLCVSGGVRTEPVMGSRSTHATTGFGSPFERPLRAGDTLPIDTPPAGAALDVDREALIHLMRSTRIDRLRYTGALTSTTATIGRDSDRIGVRLRPEHTMSAPASMDSEAMHHGAIQATPDGGLIALGPDGAPTGGYPVVASVISADLPALAHLRPGQRIRLEPVSIEDARAILRRQHDTLDRAITPRREARR